MGHVLGTSGGGLALLSSVCRSGIKAQGATGIPSNLTNDIFYIDFLSHELGHQFGAHHSYNGTTDDCSAERNAATAFEPGGGNTIMAYTGSICGAESIQALSDVNFHAGSIDEIVSYTRLGSGRFCSGDSTQSTLSPAVNAGSDFVIPLETPFTLSGSATDPDPGETLTLTYQWQQMDTGAATTDTTLGTDLGTNPLFKSFPSVSDGSRTFPDIDQILLNATDVAEVLPDRARTMNFRLLVKDGNGGVNHDDIKVRVTSVAGPFKILQPNLAQTLDIDLPQVVEWDTACTAELPVDCANVDILFSADGGVTFDEPPLLPNTPNNGQATVFFTQEATNARLKIRCTDNVFFDVSDVNFSTNSVSDFALGDTVDGGDSFECVAEPVPRRGGAVSVLFLMGFAILALFRVTNRRY